jgi:hypothetical protein
MIHFSSTLIGAGCGHLRPYGILEVVLDEVFHHRFRVRVLAHLRLSTLLVKFRQVVLHYVLVLELRYWRVKFVRHF